MKRENGFYFVKINPKSLWFWIEEEWICVYVFYSEDTQREEIFVPGLEYPIDESYITEWGKMVTV